MKRHHIMILSSITVLLMSGGAAQAVEINIETGSIVSDKNIGSNTVTEGQVVINGKVIKGATRKMTKKEQKEMIEELNREEQKIEQEMLEMENMFD